METFQIVLFFWVFLFTFIILTIKEGIVEVDGRPKQDIGTGEKNARKKAFTSSAWQTGTFGGRQPKKVPATYFHDSYEPYLST